MSQNTPGTSVYHDTAHGTVRVAPVADRPILFSAPMVRALLEGRKTQTRLIARRPTDHFHADYTAPIIVDGRAYWTGRSGSQRPVLRCRAVGDRLWVREAWARVGDAEDDIHACQDLRVHVYYRADAVCPEYQKWRSGAVMPRSASRITLVVTDVRVQRLQDISEEDAVAEGMKGTPGIGDFPAEWDAAAARRAYRDTWNSIHGHGSWQANPWVAAYTFTVHHCNIDAMPRREG